MKFVGISDPTMDVPLVELMTAAGKVVDLYNDYWLRSARIRSDELSFKFEGADLPVAAMLRFLGLRNLRVVQPDDWVHGESDQIEHLLIRTVGPWPRILFNAGGIEYEFDCSELRLDTLEDA